MTTPDELARAGSQAIEAYFASRGTEPVTAGDGRYTTYIPGKGATADLQLSLASTPAARGILARVKARRTVAMNDWPKALLAVNKWNRSSPLPHAVLAVRGEGDQSAGVLLIEGFLPFSSEPDADQVRRFIELVVAGGRGFWAGGTVRKLTRPMPAPAAAAD